MTNRGASMILQTRRQLTNSPFWTIITMAEGEKKEVFDECI